MNWWEFTVFNGAGLWLSERLIPPVFWEIRLYQSSGDEGGEEIWAVVEWGSNNWHKTSQTVWLDQPLRTHWRWRCYWYPGEGGSSRWWWRNGRGMSSRCALRDEESCVCFDWIIWGDWNDRRTYNKRSCTISSTSWFSRTNRHYLIVQCVKTLTYHPLLPSLAHHSSSRYSRPKPKKAKAAPKPKAAPKEPKAKAVSWCWMCLQSVLWKLSDDASGFVCTLSRMLLI